MSIPSDYEERVYAGVLGKIIGVYLGRPFENWTMGRILEELGEVWYYVNDRFEYPLIVTDDDITGTFTFVRALADYPEMGRDLTAAQIGRTWLNYLIENKTILWWGGLGTSTEHTGYLRLKAGYEAPRSGSIELNGQIVAEQIGGQIFIDGWAMVAPGDPELAAEFARRAASVSHDGEAIYGAQVLAAMEAQAFVEADLDKLLDVGVSFIPHDSEIYRMISDLREWRAGEPDWRSAFGRLSADYGYDKYGGGNPMVPNHGLIVLSLLYGDDDFQKTLMIVNTGGWDTDCNSGNVGCLMGIKNGLAGIGAGPDYRGPVADRLFLPAADGGRAITDAVGETYHLVNSGRRLAGLEPVAPKGGARFHFDLPGAVQGFRVEGTASEPGTPRIEGRWVFPAAKGATSRPVPHTVLAVENVPGHSQLGRRSLAIRYRAVARERPARVATATFVPPDAVEMPVYTVISSPTLYPGQTVRARVEADDQNATAVDCRLYIRAYGADDWLVRTYGPGTLLGAGDDHVFEWTVGDMGGAPIAEIGVEIGSDRRVDGTIYLDYLGWEGDPDVLLVEPAWGGTMWRRAWVNGIDWRFSGWGAAYQLVQNNGTGLVMQGTREWRDYRVTADVTPHLVKSAGIAARVQGMRRYYALLLCSDGKARLVKALDGQRILDEAVYPWVLDGTYELELTVVGNAIRAAINGQELFEVEDTERPLMGGAVALVCEEGHTKTNAVRVKPATP